MGRNTPTDQQLYDRIKRKVKKRVRVWPSAYASGQLVSEYKRSFVKKYGTKRSSYLEPKADSPLDRWYKEKWVNVCEKDRQGNFLPCGRKKATIKAEDYPYCRPLYRLSKATPKTATELTETELQKMCKYKRSLPQGVKGKPIYVRLKQQIGGSIIVTLRELSPNERSQSSKKYKKYAVDLPTDQTVYFGHNEYSDYTLHRDPSRMKNYLSRHRKREDWTISGIDTAGFWSRWILWNKPSFNDSIEDTEDQFDITIINNTNRTD